VKTARIHIGPHKTGSTTVQAMLDAGRARMADAGYLYPAADGPSQASAVCVFLATADHPLPPLDRFHVALVAHEHRRRPGSFRRLLADIDAHPGDVVISVEHLSLLTPALAEEFVGRVPVDRVEVVLVRRPPSQLLVSWYAESAKRLALPDLATFTRQVFTHLATGTPSQQDFIDTRLLVHTWAATGADVIDIDAHNGLSDTVVERTCAALTPGLSWTAPPQAANVGMSAIGVELWRAHVADHPPAFVGAADQVRDRMLATFPDTATGPKPKLSAAAATALDAYCAGTTPQLVTPDDLVEPTPEPSFDVPAALAQMAHWQRTADLRWRLLDAASRLTRRGPLMRSVA